MRIQWLLLNPNRPPHEGKHVRSFEGRFEIIPQFKYLDDNGWHRTTDYREGVLPGGHHIRDYLKGTVRDSALNSNQARGQCREVLIDELHKAGFAGPDHQGKFEWLAQAGDKEKGGEQDDRDPRQPAARPDIIGCSR